MDRLVKTAIAAWLAIVGMAWGAEGEQLFPKSPDYTVKVNGNPVEVWLSPTPQMSVPKEHMQPYSYAGFDVDGEAKVEVAWKNGGTNFTARAPFKLALTPFGRDHALLMFADQPERERPAKDRRGLKYFAAGRHRVGLLTLEPGEELYLERGAVLEGAVLGKGKNRIFGRGVISGEPWPWCKGPGGNLVQLRGDDQRIEGVILWSSYAWSLNFNGCTNSVADGVKILCGRVLNDDGIDFCRCRNAEARNCLIRTQDDCLAPKWDSDNIVATNILCWCDLANVVRIGYECSRPPLRLGNMLFKDITVARMTPVGREPTAYWANALLEMRATNECRIEDVRFEDITLQVVDDPKAHFLIMKSMKLNDDYNSGYAPKTGGYFANITFKNVTLPPRVGSNVYYFEQDAAHAFKRPDLSGVTDGMLATTAPAFAKGAKKRLVCLDLDATLCQHRMAPPPENLAALRELEKKYKCVMVGAGNAPRIYKQMGNYPIDILANYGMQESKMVNGEFKIVRQVTNTVDQAFFLRETEKLRQKYGYTQYWGKPVEFHASGMVTFALLGTTPAPELKLKFDRDRRKRRAMYPEVCQIFKDYSVFIGGSTSFDFAGPQYNKYDCIMAYAKEHGYQRDEIIFIGDDFDDGGGDSHVRIKGMDYIRIDDFRRFPELVQCLLK